MRTQKTHSDSESYRTNYIPTNAREFASTQITSFPAERDNAERFELVCESYALTYIVTACNDNHCEGEGEDSDSDSDYSISAIAGANLNLNLDHWHGVTDVLSNFRVKSPSTGISHSFEQRNIESNFKEYMS